jgi:cyclopropane-fatty-acyl-phospholipid synthase
MESLTWGNLTLIDSDGRHNFPSDSINAGPRASVRVLNAKLYSMISSSSSLGAAEAYLRGYWESDNLVDVMRIMTNNADNLSTLDTRFDWLMLPFRAAWHWMMRNSKSGSKRNISAHYDLSNEFFSLMLDPTMTYSSGYFEHAESSMEDASLAKFDRICRKLQLNSNDHLLEIGTGWGGLAIYAAKNYGCKVTTTTISKEQYEFAKKRVEELDLEDRIELLLEDYRDLDGQYDKLVSVEMIEAVGETYLDTYFAKCSSLLKPNGLMVLQAITMPDHKYDAYRQSTDFIQTYIFPGGFLPSFSAITESLRTKTDLRVEHAEDFGLHYARTLQRWQEKFWENIDAIGSLGFDERFLRTWKYYLCFCEAGFLECETGVVHLVMAKPKYRPQRPAALRSVAQCSAASGCPIRSNWPLLE